jgi:hypothetical protein
MSERDPRQKWPRGWLAFELLRRHPGYRAAWADYRARRETKEVADPHGWGAVLAGAAKHGCAAQPPAVDKAGKPGPDLVSQRWAAPFGLQYMLDPELDAEAHGHIPWRPAQGPVPVAFVAGPESFVFDPANNPHLGRGFRRFVALRFDLRRPVDAQIAEAKALLEGAQAGAVSASRGRSAAAVVRALDALDLDGAGRTNAEIAKQLSAGRHHTADDGAKLLARARRMADGYLAVANGTAGVDG